MRSRCKGRAQQRRDELGGRVLLRFLGVLELLAELILEGCLQGYLVHKKQPPPSPRPPYGPRHSPTVGS